MIKFLCINFEKFFVVLALFFITCSVIGAFKTYSPVPYLDMWDGYLDFYIRASAGDWSAWWSQHNEHRIPFAHIFFWIDIAFFKGTFWFLIVMNYILLSIACILFLHIWHTKTNQKLILVKLFIIAWLFSWIQFENLSSPFQSEFFLAYLFPLAAFYLMHMSIANKNKSFFYFILSSIFAFASIGTMANGILVLPMLTIFSMVGQLNGRRAIFLTLFSFLSLWLFFDNYVFGKYLSIQIIKENPINFLKYILYYIGGPFFYITQSKSWSLWVAQFFGILLIIGVINFSWRIFKKHDRQSLDLALLFFIAYIGAGAAITASGRLFFGVEQALSSRYMTPALMVWLAFAMLYAQYFVENIKKTIFLCFLLTITLIPNQLTAFESHRNVLYEQSLAVLALELRIKDSEQLKIIYPHPAGDASSNAARVLSLSKLPAERNLSVFGMPPWQDLKERIGQNAKNQDTPSQKCLGLFDKALKIEDDPRFVRIEGWIWDPISGTLPQVLTLIDKQSNNIIGFAFPGYSRSDITAELGKNSHRAGFKGYLLSEKKQMPILVTGKNMGCSLSNEISLDMN